MVQLEHASALLSSCRNEMAKRITGQDEMIDGLLASLIAGGHILLEGVPGLAKTLAVKSLAQITGLQFKRIQFTPDLLPADLTGTLIWNNSNTAEQSSGFSVRKGPIFANIILADEINRAPAKVQSALLEAMEEKQVTIGEKSYPLPDPFFVLATENPIEHEGTYTLPEAELDRFLMKLLISYPQPAEELEIVKNSMSKQQAPLSQVLNSEALSELRQTADSIHVDDEIAKYIVSIVTATRPGDLRFKAEGVYKYISFGASPRASIAMYKCSKIFAMYQGRQFVSPEDVKIAAFPILRHRIVLSYEAEAEGMDTDAVIARILNHVPVP